MAGRKEHPEATVPPIAPVHLPWQSARASFKTKG